MQCTSLLSCRRSFSCILRQGSCLDMLSSCCKYHNLSRTQPQQRPDHKRTDVGSTAAVDRKGQRFRRRHLRSMERERTFGSSPAATVQLIKTTGTHPCCKSHTKRHHKTDHRKMGCHNRSRRKHRLTRQESKTQLELGRAAGGAGGSTTTVLHTARTFVARWIIVVTRVAVEIASGIVTRAIFVTLVALAALSRCPRVTAGEVITSTRPVATIVTACG